MTLDQIAVLNLVKTADGGLGVATALGQNVFLVSNLLMLLPWLLLLLIATYNKSLLKQSFLSMFLTCGGLAVLIFFGITFGLIPYLTSLT